MSCLCASFKYNSPGQITMAPPLSAGLTISSSFLCKDVSDSQRCLCERLSYRVVLWFVFVFIFKYFYNWLSLPKYIAFRCFPKAERKFRFPFAKDVI